MPPQTPCLCGEFACVTGTMPYGGRGRYMHHMSQTEYDVLRVVFEVGLCYLEQP